MRARIRLEIKTKAKSEMINQTGKTAGAHSPTDPKNRAPQERRQKARYILRDARGKLTWSEGSDRVTCNMTVLNISGGGAAVLADRAPTTHQTVWLSLKDSMDDTEPWEAHLVATSADPSGKHLVRVRFTFWVPLDAILELHEERRLWQRYPAREKRATLFWVEQDVQHTIPGELLNISGGGAAVITEPHPPANTALFLGLETEAIPIIPIEAKLVVVSLDISGSNVVRLSFVDSCPMEMFELAVYGPNG